MSPFAGMLHAAVQCVNSFTDEFTRLENPLAILWTNRPWLGTTNWAADADEAVFTGPAAGPTRVGTRLVLNSPLCTVDQEVELILTGCPATAAGTNADTIGAYMRCDSTAPTTGYLCQLTKNGSPAVRKLTIALDGTGIIASKTSDLMSDPALVRGTADGTDITVYAVSDGGPDDNDTLTVSNAALSTGNYVAMNGSINVDHAAGSQSWKVNTVTAETI